MADTAEHPATQPLPPFDGSITEAQSALLGLMDPEEDKPEEEEAKPTEVEESIPEEEDESLEEETEEEEESEEEEEESEESDEEEDSGEELYAVKVDGEDVEVTLEELTRGYSRQSDYTKKTQEIAEYRKNYEIATKAAIDEVTQTQQSRQQYVDALANMVQMEYAQLQSYDNINWDELKETDQDAYLVKRDEYREAQGRIKEQQEAIYYEQQQQEEESAKQMQTLRREEFGKLATIIPQWSNAEFRNKVGSELNKFALSKGFSPEELSQLYDHRSILLLMEAKAFEDSQKGKKTIKAKKLKNKPKVVRSGKGSSKKSDSRIKRTKSMKRLQETGHVNDAIGLFEDFVEL